MGVMDKRAVASCFSQAAGQYDRYAALQRRVGASLLHRLPPARAAVGLDLGCGTGYLHAELGQRCERLLGVDLALGMLKVARARAQGSALPHISWLQGDAERLPLADGVVDWGYSSLALQWCDELALPLTQIRRCLKPGGLLVFSTLLEGTLEELRQSWQALDPHSHVNRFLSLEQVRQAARQAGFGRIELCCETEVMRYTQVIQLLRELKGIGASHVGGARRGGLTSPRMLARLDNHYRHQFALADGSLPASYRICYGVLHVD